MKAFPFYLMRTRNGIYKNLEESHWIYCAVYEEDNIWYHFSSQLYMQKFAEQINKHRENINESLSNRFKFNIRHNILADIHLYKTIEKRGFFITTKDGGLSWQNFQKLDGQNLIIENSSVKEKTITQKSHD